MIPASIRNNNPGAMYPGPSAKKFGSKRFETLKSHDGTHKIACFDDPVHGAAAQFGGVTANTVLTVDMIRNPGIAARGVRSGYRRD